MTKQEALSIIKQACVSSNPSILDLKFGCEVEIQNYAVTVVVWQDRRTWVYLPESGEPNTDFVGLAHSLAYFDEKHIKQILGRPITLADVLWAIQINDKPITEVWTIDMWGGFKLIHNDIKHARIENFEIKWNLLLPLHEQSEPTLLFIAGILKK